MACSALLKKASLVGAFFVSVFFLVPALALCPAPGALQSVEVLRVVDGDTLRLVDGRSVRLIGLNSPELGRDGRSAEPYAEAARRRLDELVSASDRRIGLRLGREARDRYGRILAHGFDARGRNLEAQLLAEGLGYLVAIPPNVQLLECQRAAERGARRAAVGLWRRPPQLAPRQLTRGGFALVRGRVERVERNGGGVWLELDGPLVLRVAPQALAQFDGRRLQGLAGKRVEARGWVVDRARRGGVKPGQARWLLPLSHEAMLEVLR
ncbi:thermonuclease family protein [Pseudomonas lalucatii]|uniref:Thermonuclease family protein n=1 Tax=Pseudomonas lalucatii TaxID=1424203 RepID=A0ABS5Q0P2_9PSED|nr:thermonuclease family protein [Pseudomonas lalucatii]MBS7662322.1 thermonuclease family protein [Pseudomonas lalucatii]QVM88428.1 thermonuclease family protein [Pseudomonas lalucatii]